MSLAAAGSTGGAGRRFEHLFREACIGRVELKNRIVYPAQVTLFGTEDGYVTERLIEYHKAKARGGVGLIIVEATCVESPRGKVVPRQLRIDDDRYIVGLAELAEHVHRLGCKIVLQLHHAGRATNLISTGGAQLVAASEVPCFPRGGFPRALQEEEVEALEEKFGEAGRRARDAGFDGVEIHGAHGYLIANFLSPFTNKRVDKYGGNVDGRVRFAANVIRSVRRKAGDGFPVIFRLSGDEMVEGGNTLRETAVIARKLEEAGAAAIHVSAGVPEAAVTIPPLGLEPGCFVRLAEGIRRAVGVPVIAVGKINDPCLAETILEEERADLVAMGRALIADPELPNKARRGALAEIRPCVACNHCSKRTVPAPGFGGLPLSCAVNPVVGREQEFSRLRPAAPRRRVLIVGGGLAGMECARVAASRGNQVTLVEKESRLGGQLHLATAAPDKQELAKVLGYLERELARLAVEIRLNTVAGEETVAQLAPDRVVLAQGARPAETEFPGAGGKPVCQAWDVLGGKTVRGDRVAVIGGGSVGCEAADYLSHAGKQVVVVEMMDEIGRDVEPASRHLLLKRLREKGVDCLTGLRVERVTEQGLIAVDRHWKSHVVPCDAIVLALGVVPVDGLGRRLDAAGIECFKVGDCRRPGTILDAIHDGFCIGNEI